MTRRIAVYARGDSRLRASLREHDHEPREVQPWTPHGLLRACESARKTRKTRELSLGNIGAGTTSVVLEAELDGQPWRLTLDPHIEHADSFEEARRILEGYERELEAGKTVAAIRKEQDDFEDSLEARYG